MVSAVLSIGTELTRGEIVNTNAAHLAARLTDLGFEVVEIATVDDDIPRILYTLRRLSSSCALIVCTGGLGPTTDDLTAEAAAAALGVPLRRNEDAMLQVRQRFQQLGRPMSPSNEKQAFLPEGAEILPNAHGSAPGFALHFGESVAFFLPGVPAEMLPMFDTQIAPRVSGIARNNRVQRRLHTFGLGESLVGERLAGVEELFHGVTLGYRVHFPEVEVKVLAVGATPADTRDLCDRATVEVRRRLGPRVYGEDNDTLGAVLGTLLRAKASTLAVAESCTGGLVGHLITRQAGASDYLLLDAVTYSNASKTTLLGIKEETLGVHGAVSEHVAAAMASGVQRLAGATFGLAVTGIAGPGGATETKPVGTVFLAVATPDRVEVSQRHFGGDRERVQMLAAYTALDLLRKVCCR
jgi:nicotinamide-nucleotide amidase